MAADDSDDDLVEELWDRVDDFESRNESSLFTLLPEAGVSLPPPDELGDAELTARLWEVIHALAVRGVYLENTNHLSDRELYAHLWHETLREPVVLMPENAAYGVHLDVIGSGNDEDTLLFFKYYASEESRRSWMKDWPDYEMPDREDPPFDRDGRLPQRDWGKRDEPVM